MGSEKYDQVYGMNQDKVNPSIELERRLYPQGGNKQVALRDDFQKATPFYLKQNTTIFLRKPNQQNYESAIEMARNRFEQKL